MDTSPHPAAHWRSVVAGGATPLPRWSTGASPPRATRTVPVPSDLLAAAARAGADLGVDLEAVLLAAHARVLAALVGEDEVLTLLAGAVPVPVRLDTGVATWRALVGAAAWAARDAREHGARGGARDALAAVRAGAGAAWPETVLDPAGVLPDVTPSADGEAVRVTWTPTGTGGVIVRVRHRSDVLDGDAAERVAGYHLAALAHLVADVDAAPGAGGLVGAAESRYVAEVLGGPVRTLPDVRPHDLVRERARRHPERVAVRRGGVSWTYAELDGRSDAVARALLARGLRGEDVVAVVTERSPEWAAAVLGVLKAGGAYLPIEPGFPAGRIATVLRRAGARLVLAERGATATLDEALAELPDRARLLVDEAIATGAGTAAPTVAVDAGALAYLYFTSGSTGEPKGAMCEHAGMLNHLLAKIEDLGVAEGDVVAQTAPQCFDISLWQLVAPWLVGATTLLVEQEAVLDVPRLVELFTTERVAVAQLVPSYLDVVVSALGEAPAGALGSLRCLAVTGEAVKRELVARWFAVRPAVPLVNAYGLTETSDDTNHAVLTAVPEGERVPLGPAVRNVRIEVVDEHLHPVPLGAPGEIVFGGVCVGRGYVNDPERTAAAFLPDPREPGARRYRSGDHGRWLPTGELDFLGRRDHQVKISGFRIEIGEVENTLLRVAGVRDAAVVVHDRPGRGAQLVGFYGAPAPLADADVRAVLGAALPAYMVPPVIHHRDALPLTANGKIDRSALGALAGALDTASGTAPGPSGDAGWTATERRVAGLWAELLGLDEATIRRDDDFVERGASSLLGVKLAVRLGKVVTLAEIARRPVLRDLAALLDARADDAPTGPIVGLPVPRRPEADVVATP